MSNQESTLIDIVNYYSVLEDKKLDNPKWMKLNKRKLKKVLKQQDLTSYIYLDLDPTLVDEKQQEQKLEVVTFSDVFNKEQVVLLTKVDLLDKQNLREKNIASNLVNKSVSFFYETLTKQANLSQQEKRFLLSKLNREAKNFKSVMCFNEYDYKNYCLDDLIFDLRLNFVDHLLAIFPKHKKQYVNFKYVLGTLGGLTTNFNVGMHIESSLNDTNKEVLKQQALDLKSFFEENLNKYYTFLIDTLSILFEQKIEKCIVNVKCIQIDTGLN